MVWRAVNDGVLPLSPTVQLRISPSSPPVKSVRDAGSYASAVILPACAGALTRLVFIVLGLS
jgi:hypothetical protein